MADIRIVDEVGKDITSEPQPMESASTENDDTMTPLLQRAIGNVLGLENDTEFGQYKHKINTLLDYAKSQTTDHSPENIKWIIRSLEMKLGSAPFAEKRINYVARFAYLDMESHKLAMEKEKFLKSGIK